MGIDVDNNLGYLQSGTGVLGYDLVLQKHDLANLLVKTVTNSYSTDMFVNGSIGTNAGLVLLDGTAGTPAMRFNSDPNTGIYSSGADQIGFAAGGSLAAMVNSTGFKAIDGSASNPSMSFSGDPNTGWYSSGADELSIATGGTQRASFAAQLQLKTAGSAGTPSLAILDGTTGLYRSAANELSLAVSGARAFTVGTQIEIARSGSAGAPAMVIGGLDTGIYSSGAGVVDLAAGGTRRVSISASQVLMALGTDPLTPNLGILGDPDTGFYSSGTNTLNIAAAGTQIGSFSSTQVLVRKSADLTNVSLGFIGDVNTGLHSSGAGAVSLVAGGVVRATANSSGFAISEVAFTGEAGASITADGTGIEFYTSSTQRANLTNQLAMTKTSVPATPTYTFIGDENTGFYSSGADQIDIALGGNQRAYFAGQQLALSLGAVGTPALTFIGDENTGIYSAGADQLNMATGGSLRLSLDTSALTSSLVIKAPNGAATATAYSFTNATNAGLYLQSSTLWSLAVGGGAAMNIQNTNSLTEGVIEILNSNQSSRSLEVNASSGTYNGSMVYLNAARAANSA
jgi:hypothetical protein